MNGLVWITSSDEQREYLELDLPTDTTDEFFSSIVRLQSHVRPRFQQGLRCHMHLKKKRIMQQAMKDNESI